MKINHSSLVGRGNKSVFAIMLRREKCKLVQTFGQADLVRRRDGRFELRGGLAKDRTAAREWASLFFHEAVFGSRTGGR